MHGRQLTRSSDGLVTIEVNIAPRNHREAALSIALALFVIIELMVFISVLNNTAMDLLVKPVAHILHVIRTQAQKVMAALDTDEVSPPCPTLFSIGSLEYHYHHMLKTCWEPPDAQSGLFGRMISGCSTLLCAMQTFGRLGRSVTAEGVCQREN